MPTPQTWQERLKAYLGTEDVWNTAKEHAHQCASYSEGQECCLEKEWIKTLLAAEIALAEECGRKEQLKIDQEFFDKREADMCEKLDGIGSMIRGNTERIGKNTEMMNENSSIIRSTTDRITKKE